MSSFGLIEYNLELSHIYKGCTSSILAYTFDKINYFFVLFFRVVLLQKISKMDRLMPGASAFIPSKPKNGKKSQKVLSEDSDIEEEPAPSKLEKVGKKKKKQAFSQRSYRFYLPGLDLPKDSKAHYPDFNWLDLVAKEEEAKVAATMKKIAATKRKETLDPFASDDEDVKAC